MVKSKRKLIILILLAVFVIGVSVSCVSAADSSSGSSVKAKQVSQNDVLRASKSIKTYTEKNKKLPGYVTIKNQKYSMEEYMYLSSVTLKYRYYNKKNAVTVKYNIKSPSAPSGTKVSGSLTKKQFTTYGVSAYKYIIKYGKAPNYVSTKIGKMQFQTFVYGNSKILAWSANNKAKLPNSLTMSVSAGHSINKNMPKYSGSSGSSETPGTNPPSQVKSVSMKNIFEASNRVKVYIEKNNAIPKTVTIESTTYSINDFLYLMSKAIVNRNSGSTSSVAVLSTSAPSSPSGNNKLGKIYKAEFVSIAKNLVNYYSTNKKAPNYVSSDLGNLQYQSTIYIFSRIGAYIHNNKNAIPSYVDVTVDSSSKINGGDGGSSSGQLADYLKATKNCQVNDAKIQALAKQLTAGLTSELSKATAIFNYVRDEIAYSFYYNTAKGAVGTLNAKSGNCVDKTHLLLALLRASGIGGRYVNGKATFSSSGHIGHTWAEVYIDGKWVIADITSSRNTLGNVNNCWNHEVWSRTAEITF